VIACPNCKRRVFTRLDILYAPLDGTAQCRACRQIARPDLLSRWMLSCVLAILLPAVFLFAGVFYSGHFFVILIVIVLGAWRIFCFLGFPLLTLEAVSRGSPIDRRESILILVVLVAASILLDSYMSSRFDSDDEAQNGHAPTAVHRDR
jgi:hypothetical protein